MKKVILFINGQLGLKILGYLSQRSDTVIVGIVMNAKLKRSENYETRIKDIVDENNLCITTFEYSPELWKQESFLELIDSQILGISALFGHIFPPSIIKKFNGQLINLHPSLLPIGRGADPVFWSKKDSLPQGATIHFVDEGLDTGNILMQAEVNTEYWETSGAIYEKAIDTLWNLFTKLYPNWSKSLKGKPQIGIGTSHSSKELNKIRQKLLSDSSVYLEVLNLVQALNFNDGRKFTVKTSRDEIWEVALQLNKLNKES